MTLQAFHDNLVNAVKDAVLLANDTPLFQTAESYFVDRDTENDPEVTDKTERPIQKIIKTPAIYLEVEDFEEAAEQSSDETLNLDMRCRVLVIASFKTKSPNIAMRELAARVAVEIHKHDANAKAFQIFEFKDFDKPAKLHEYLVWVVEFTRDKCFGESVFQAEEINITDVCFGYSPNIGLNHIDEYVSLEIPEEES